MTLTRNRYLLPALSGLLHAVSVHLPAGAFLGLFALVPLLYSVMGTEVGRKNPFVGAGVYGLVFGLLTQTWALDSAYQLSGGLTRGTLVYYLANAFGMSFYGLFFGVVLWLAKQLNSAPVSHSTAHDRGGIYRG